MELSKGLQATSSEMIMSNDEEKIEMKINANAMNHIIARLTDLYENPIEATVREVISNAIDTTKRLSLEDQKPIKVILPTTLNREFIVIDFGEGMSFETIKTIYSQYGASTKGSDMTQVGAYGLGAKAPLSYVSSFVVESTKDGETTEILISSEQDGNYSRVISHKNTDKPNGTRVTIPVNEDDEDEFIAAAESYHKYSLGIQVEFSNHTYSTAPNLMEIGNINVEDNIEVPLYIKADNNSEILDLFLRQRFSDPAYLLSGWNYGSGNRWRGDTFYVELIPGLLDFSSSRDSITKNNRYNKVSEVIKEKIPTVLKTYLNKIKESGEFTDEETLTTLANFIRNSSYTYAHSEVQEFIDNLKNKDGFLFVDMLKEKAEDDFICLFSRDADSKATYKPTIDSSSFYRGEQLNLTDLRTELIEKSYKFGPRAILTAFALSENKVTVVTDIPDYDSAAKLLNKSIRYIKEKNYRNQVFALSLKDKNTLEPSLNKYLLPTMYSYVSYDDFLSLTKIVSKPKTEKEKEQEAIKISLYTYSGMESFGNSKYQPWSSWALKSREAINEAGDYKILFIKDSLTSYGSIASSPMIHNACLNHDTVVAAFITATNINSNNIDFLVNNFDEVYVMQDVEFRGKKVQEKSKNFKIKEPTKIYNIEIDSVIGKNILLDRLRNLIFIYEDFYKFELNSKEPNAKLNELFTSYIENNPGRYRHYRSISDEQVNILQDEKYEEINELIKKMTEFWSENESILGDIPMGRLTNKGLGAVIIETLDDLFSC